MNESTLNKMYDGAVDFYGELGVDVVRAMARLKTIPVSLHCWQGDDVSGFEHSAALDGGLVATGNYPGKATTGDELRSDIDKVFALVPGKHRVNLHAIYAETEGKKVDRDELGLEHFSKWLGWGKENGLGFDFNGSFFSHPKAASGLTLSSADDDIRKFWVEHGKVCRKIGAGFGQELGTPCVTNVWIPDGSKDEIADRVAPRKRLTESLDAIFAEKLDPKHNLDAVESKLFGIGSESFVVGSHEYYMGYAISRGKMVCLDTGHFHPTESIVDKISAVMEFTDEVLLHVSRGVRWDSDHVVLLTDDLKAIAREIVWNGFENRTHVGLDFFDASINRITAWVTGIRSMQKALLGAMLDPAAAIRSAEVDGDFSSRMALMEDAKSAPFGAVWNKFCSDNGVPADGDWMAEVKSYEADVLSKRG